jgi:hypothetical protein
MCYMAIGQAVMGGTMSTVGAWASVKQSKQNMRYQNAILKNQASMETSRANVAEQNAVIQRQRLAQQRRQEKAEGMTDFAANGLLLDGSTTDAPNIWEQDFAAETAWRQEEIRSNALYEIWGHNENAKALLAQRGINKKNFQYNTLATVAQNASANSSAASSSMGSMGSMMSSQ